MKLQRERSRLSLAAALVAVLAWLGSGASPALAQSGSGLPAATGGGAATQTQAGNGLLAQTGSSVLAQAGGTQQQAGTPWYKVPFIGTQGALFDFSESPGPLKGLSVSGFVNISNGMWVDSAGIRYQKSKNSLAVQRDWLQLDINYVLSGDNRFFIRWWGVYEPAYPFEYDSGLTDMGDYYNQYTVRDAYWKSKMGPLTLFLGRQIVTWGESVAFRVGDVINPQDFSWNFGFANLEQSRLPLYMLHPILDLPSWGPFKASFIEGVWAPAWQPMYTQMDTPNQCTPSLCPGVPGINNMNWYSGQHDVAGNVSIIGPFTIVAQSRFETYPYPYTFLTPGIPANETAFPQLASSSFAPPFFAYHLNGDTLANSNEGFRLHSLIGNSEVTFIYWHGHQFNEAGTPGAPFYVVGSPSTGQYLQAYFPQFNDIGVTLNRPLYFPGQFLSQIPFVLRTEGVWQDRTPFNTVDTGVRNGVVDKDTFNTLIALDNDGVYAPWLTATGTLSSVLEWNNFILPSYGKNLVYTFYAERYRHVESQLLFSTSTSWWWGAVVPSYTMIWNPSGNTTLLFPSIVLTPPWTNKYFTTFEYIGILGNDKFNSFAGGTFKGKSILFLQFQYNFQLAQGKT